MLPLIPANGTKGKQPVAPTEGPEEPYDPEMGPTPARLATRLSHKLPKQGQLGR